MVDPSPEKEGGFGMMIPAKDGGPTLAQKEEQAIAGQELTLNFELDGYLIHSQKFKSGQGFDWVIYNLAQVLGLEYSDVILYKKDKIIPGPLAICDMNMEDGELVTVKIEEDADLEESNIETIKQTATKIDKEEEKE